MEFWVECTRPPRWMEALEKLHRETARVLALPELCKRFDDLGMEAIGNAPAEFAAVIATETPQWARVIQAAGIAVSGE